MIDDATIISYEEERANPLESTYGGVTIGVEEEFLLVDQDSAATVPYAAAVLADAMKRPRSADDAALHAELLSSQVEAATGRCTTLAEVAMQLVFARRQLGAAARNVGARVLASGTPVATPETIPPLTSGPRFRQVGTTYQGVVTDYQACGCHTHVGVTDQETRVAVVNHVRPWLPTLLALSGNSPLHLGHDTGYASWRMMQQTRFPGSGLPPRFASARDYENHVATLVECGTLIDTNMSFWLARPSPQLPTVEFRVADTAIQPEEAVLQAALARALVRTAMHELSHGREGPHINEQIGAAAVWSAARYGLRGHGVHPLREVRVPATILLHEMLEWISPALDETDDTATMRTALRKVAEHGTGAERQRIAATQGMSVLLNLIDADDSALVNESDTPGSSLR